MIRLTRPAIDDHDVAAMADVLRSGMLVQGERVGELESLLAQRCQRQHAVAVSNGTAALYLALQALGVGPGDEVLCPDLTWPSPAHAIANLGADPVLVDVDLREWNVLPGALKAARTARTKAIVAIDQFGNPARADEIARELPDLPIVIDAACSLGSDMVSGPCGSAGVVACLSFHPRKVITTGEGGMCLTNDEKLAHQLRLLRNHGQVSPGQFAAPSGNYRLTEMAAAMGIVQARKLDQLIAQRRSLAERYIEALPTLAFQQPPPGSAPNYQTMGLLLSEDLGGAARDQLIAKLREQGVEAGRLSYALHRLPHLKPWGDAAASLGRTFAASDAIADRGLAIPLYPGMTRADQDTVIAALTTTLRTELGHG